MNKNITILIVLLIVAAAGLYFWRNNTGMSLGNSTLPTTIQDNNSHPVAKEGEHCGGNMTNAPVCGEGYACEPDPQSHLPFGDVGGICVKASAAVQGEFGQ